MRLDWVIFRFFISVRTAHKASDADAAEQCFAPVSLSPFGRSERLQRCRFHQTAKSTHAGCMLKILGLARSRRIFMTGICSALQGIRRGCGGAMFCPRFALALWAERAAPKVSVPPNSEEHPAWVLFAVWWNRRELNPCPKTA